MSTRFIEEIGDAMRSLLARRSAWMPRRESVDHDVATSFGRPTEARVCEGEECKDARPGSPPLLRTNLPQTYAANGGGAQHDPWSDYHVLIALIMLMGAFYGIRSIDQLIGFLDHLNALEESGMAASVLVVGSRALRLTRAIVSMIASLLRR